MQTSLTVIDSGGQRSTLSPRIKINYIQLIEKVRENYTCIIVYLQTEVASSVVLYIFENIFSSKFVTLKY